MYNLSILLPLLTFAFVTSATPGPNNVMLMSSGLNFGFKSTIPHLLGVVLGFPVMILLVGIGLLQLFELVPHSFTLLKILSGIYLLYLAWRIASTKSLSSGESSTKPLRFIQAALFQWVNPKAWAMALMAISLYTPETIPLFSVLVVAMAFVISGAFSCSLWTLLGHHLKRFLNNPIKCRAVNIFIAVLLVFTLLPLLLQGQEVN